MSSLFITGASGFIGHHVLLQLTSLEYTRVYCLSRRANTTIEKKGTKNVYMIQGDIFDCERYAPYLAECETVIHMAAATGKVNPKDSFSVNSNGTQVLIDQCRNYGIKNFLHVSTIAVKYIYKQRYYYAQSKKIAEQIVQNSGMNYSIIRPTMVIGKDGPVWNSLLRLAKLSIIPIFGDGKSKIQPIYISDLVNCLLDIVGDKRFNNEIYELGGPEIMCFGDFLKKIHYAYHGRNGSCVHIPLMPLITMLYIMEKLMYSMLPINIGQLASFRNNSTIEANYLFNRHAHRMKNIDEMLDLVLYDV